MRVSRRGYGFSLVEILISIILVGLSITALVFASNSFTMANGAGADLSTAEFLVEQIREMTTLLPVRDPDVDTWTTLGPNGESDVANYNDVDDFDGFNSATLGAPIDALGNPLSDLAAFSQGVTVDWVSQSNFNQISTSATPFVRVTATVALNGREICSASWIRADY